ncbi:UNVERIFIED_CONTAM: putative E3 ubiquitin-protein ligase march10 [Gekko kuhli]
MGGQASAPEFPAGGAELGAVKTCELCKQSLTADLDDFNVNDYYRIHQQSQAQSELMNSGLYLVLLLHLYEQRFAELMRLNYNQASRDRICHNEHFCAQAAAYGKLSFQAG